jgi:hypothetical protein
VLSIEEVVMMFAIACTKKTRGHFGRFYIRIGGEEECRNGC